MIENDGKKTKKQRNVQETSVQEATFSSSTETTWVSHLLESMSRTFLNTRYPTEATARTKTKDTAAKSIPVFEIAPILSSHHIPTFPSESLGRMYEAS